MIINKRFATEYISQTRKGTTVRIENILVIWNCIRIKSKVSGVEKWFPCISVFSYWPFNHLSFDRSESFVFFIIFFFFLFLTSFSVCVCAVGVHRKKQCNDLERVHTDPVSNIVNPSLAEHVMPCLRKQCRSRSVGFWRSQLIWI